MKSCSHLIIVIEAISSEFIQNLSNFSLKITNHKLSQLPQIVNVTSLSHSIHIHFDLVSCLLPSSSLSNLVSILQRLVGLFKPVSSKWKVEFWSNGNSILPRVYELPTFIESFIDFVFESSFCLRHFGPS